MSAALDGSGPALFPLSPDLPEPALWRLLHAVAPATVETAGGTHRFVPRDPAVPVGGVPVAADTAVLVATAGSTGRPKIVELSARALRFSAAATLARIEAAAGDPWLCSLPTSHIAGIQVIVRALLAGSELIVHPRFDVAAIARAATDAPHLAVVPTQLRRLVEAGVDLSRFRSLLLGGAPPPVDLLETARTAGARLFTTYGSSETSGGCVYDGVPLTGVRADVGQDGRIRLAGPQLFERYHGDPARTAAARDGDWFVTEDLGVIESGRLRVLGRTDDVINTGGEKVNATEVAARLSCHPLVREVVVVGRPDPEWGERVTAVVVPAGPVPQLDDLRAWVRATLPAHAAPRELELVAAIPLLPSGKPDRRRLQRGELP
ncbi:AMP-binding protein [Micromonospora sp. HUAS LYJ1]|uniref:AMP-binding protein n=1 Tax=Micromonospora sp. HUAS LYJ1 TaxID=3061626 RepID=UPI00267349C8|nr:AMP-binding protein [Micromonospora sp. HUAS LYJ1]WKU07150.1 AMP-binding protein [Micromonospora sp. HUAS LYJ1]